MGTSNLPISSGMVWSTIFIGGGRHGVVSGKDMCIGGVWGGGRVGCCITTGMVKLIEDKCGSICGVEKLRRGRDGDNGSDRNCYCLGLGIETSYWIPDPQPLHHRRRGGVANRPRTRRGVTAHIIMGATAERLLEFGGH